MKRIHSAAGVLALSLAIGSCCTDPIDQSSYFCLGDMSLAEEQELGDSYAPMIDAQYDGVYGDAEAFAYLDQLVKEMASHSIRAKDSTWRFTILNTSIPNAFAVPGGYIYITRGLLAAMETEGQFISVMGHELGHVEHRHSHQQMGRSAMGSVFAGALDLGEQVLLGSGSTGIAGTVGGAAAQLVLLRYDRGQESQSDKRGIYYAATMGYDPMEGIKTFAYFEKLEKESGGETPEFLRTHPLNSTRIADIENEIKTSHPEVIGKPKSSFRPYRDGNDRFEKIVARIKSVQPTYDRYDKALETLAAGIKDKKDAKIQEARTVMQDCAANVPKEALFQTGVGYANYLLKDYGGAASSLQKAVQLDDSYLPERKLFDPRYFLGIALQADGELDQAKSRLLEASKIIPHPAPHLHLGEIHEAQGRKADAIKEYKQVIELEGDPKGTFTQEATKRLKALGP